jgi:hypothetical protein
MTPPVHPFDELFEETLKRVKKKHDPNARLLRFNDQIVAMVEYSIPVNNPKLKQKALAAQIRFLEDRAELSIVDFPHGSFLYADPKFPGNMYRQI